MTTNKYGRAIDAETRTAIGPATVEDLAATLAAAWTVGPSVGPWPIVISASGQRIFVKDYTVSGRAEARVLLGQPEHTTLGELTKELDISIRELHALCGELLVGWDDDSPISADRARAIREGVDSLGGPDAARWLARRRMVSYQQHPLPNPLPRTEEAKAAAIRQVTPLWLLPEDSAERRGDVSARGGTLL